MYSKMKLAVAVVMIGALVIGVAGYVLLTEHKDVLSLATTTSTYDSGLLDHILPEFERVNDCEVDVIAVGSGQAMEMGKRGDVDVLLVHSPAAETTFVMEGYGEARNLVMYNSYVLVGPLADPAGLNHSVNVSMAFRKIHDNGTVDLIDFVTRGDNSGTHAQELTIWKGIGLNASTFPNEWYISPGAGMGAVLDMCEQTDAYTLSDDATYYQRQSEKLIPNLKIVYNDKRTDPTLRNQYSVIVLNGTRFPHIDHVLATSFKDWLVSQEGQELIASYERYGQQLFVPNAAGHVPPARALAAVTPSSDERPSPPTAVAVASWSEYSTRVAVSCEIRW